MAWAPPRSVGLCERGEICGVTFHRGDDLRTMDKRYVDAKQNHLLDSDSNIFLQRTISATVAHRAPTLPLSDRFRRAMVVTVESYSTRTSHRAT